MEKKKEEEEKKTRERETRREREKKGEKKKNADNKRKRPSRPAFVMVCPIRNPKMQIIVRL